MECPRPRKIFRTLGIFIGRTKLIFVFCIFFHAEISFWREKQVQWSRSQIPDSALSLLHSTRISAGTDYNSNSLQWTTSETQTRDVRGQVSFWGSSRYSSRQLSRRRKWHHPSFACSQWQYWLSQDRKQSLCCVIESPEGLLHYWKCYAVRRTRPCSLEENHRRYARTRKFRRPFEACLSKPPTKSNSGIVCWGFWRRPWGRV